MIINTCSICKKECRPMINPVDFACSVVWNMCEKCLIEYNRKKYEELEKDK